MTKNSISKLNQKESLKRQVGKWRSWETTEGVASSS